MNQTGEPLKSPSDRTVYMVYMEYAPGWSSVILDLALHEIGLLALILGESVTRATVLYVPCPTND